MMRVRAAAVLLAALAIPGPAAPGEPAPLGGPSAASTPASTKRDRALDRGELRAALFAAQDEVNLQPRSADARVRLGRAYLALGYAARARAQAEQALALAADDAEARRLLDDALADRAPPPRSVERVAAAGAAVAATGTASRATPSGSGRDAGRPAALPPAAAGPDGAPGAAALRYRAGVDLLARGDDALAAAALDPAIAADPTLGVANVARGNARLGLGRTRAAAQDYAAALELDPRLAMPLYGLAECYRAEGDPRALELYSRYAESRAADVREDLRTLAVRRVSELALRR